MVKSLIAKGERGGFLPFCPARNSYASEMMGDHAVAVIADVYIKGIRSFDSGRAYELMRRNATQLRARHELYLDGRWRRALGSYLQYGYIPLEIQCRMLSTRTSRSRARSSMRMTTLWPGSHRGMNTLTEGLTVN